MSHDKIPACKVGGPIRPPSGVNSNVHNLLLTLSVAPRCERGASTANGNGEPLRTTLWSARLQLNALDACCTSGIKHRAFHVLQAELNRRLPVPGFPSCRNVTDESL